MPKVKLTRDYLHNGRLRKAGRVLNLTAEKYVELQKQGYFDNPEPPKITFRRAAEPTPPAVEEE